MFCLQCGNKVPGESKFCFKCGVSLRSVAGITSEERQAGPAIGVEAKAVAAPPEGENRKEISKDCPNCGLVNPSAAERCDCGYDFFQGSGGEAPTQRYRWGKFVGIASLLATALYTSMAIDPNRFSADFGSPLLPRPLAILLTAVSAVAGVGILRRRRFGVIAYAFAQAIGLVFNLLKLTDQNVPENLKAGLGLGLFTGVPFALATFVYFGKRWKSMSN